MNRKMLRPLLEANVGKPVAVTYNGETQEVLIVSVDPDGFICKPVSEAHGDATSEFWLSFLDTAEVAPIPTIEN